MVINLHGLDFEVHSYGAHIVVIELVVTEPQQHRSLTRIAFSYENNFEESLVVIGLEVLGVLHNSLLDHLGLSLVLHEGVVVVLVDDRG